MPTIFRVMTPDGDFPLCGNSGRTLGIRENVDIPIDGEGFVAPGSGGMSVSPDLRSLPSHRLPARLRPLMPRASGSNNDVVWKHGDGAREPKAIHPGLLLRLDPNRPKAHGFVEPDDRMSGISYLNNLHQTRKSWSRAEG